MLRYPKTFLIGLAAVLYAPTLYFTWVFLDDYLIVQRSAYFSRLSNIPAAFLSSVWAPSGNEYNFYRPVSTALYIAGGWLSHVVAGEIQPWSFHFTNVLLQCAVAPLLFVLFRSLGSPAGPALIAASFLVLQPVSAGTVAWIGGQNELLLALFCIAGFISFVKAVDSPRWLFAHAFCLLLALLTKENAAALPVLCLLYMLIATERPSRKFWLSAVAVWIATASLWFLLVRQGGGEEGPSAGRALFAMAHGMPYFLVYLGQMSWPFELTTLPIALDTGWPTWLAGGAFAAMLFGITLFKLREKLAVLLGAAWFAGYLLPTFGNLVPEQKDIYILRADRGYLAAAGLAIIVLQLDLRHLDRKPVKILAAALLPGLLALNLIHQTRFADAAAFYQSAVRGSPRSPFARTHLGDVYLAEKNYARAIAEYEEAIRLNPRERQTHNNLGVAFLRTGRIDDAAEAFKKDIEVTPNSLLAWPNLGMIYLDRGDYANAEKAFRRSVEINPSFKDGWAGLVRVYTATHDETKRLDASLMLNRAEMDMKSGL